jgi:microcompartment protein CcmL/EutN
LSERADPKTPTWRLTPPGWSREPEGLGPRPSQPAVALLELESIVRGMVVADAVLKRAEVQIALGEPVTPGKYLLLFHGGVAEVEESFAAGMDAAGPALLDSLLLPQADRGLVNALRGEYASPSAGESVGLVETHSVAAALKSADVALKRADVTLLRLHLARGIGGKGYFTFSGALDRVEAALEGAAACLDPNLLLTAELIRSPHPGLRQTVL